MVHAIQDTSGGIPLHPLDVIAALGTLPAGLRDVALSAFVRTRGLPGMAGTDATLLAALLAPRNRAALAALARAGRPGTGPVHPAEGTGRLAGGAWLALEDETEAAGTPVPRRMAGRGG